MWIASGKRSMKGVTSNIFFPLSDRLRFFLSSSKKTHYQYETGKFCMLSMFKCNDKEEIKLITTTFWHFLAAKIQKLLNQILLEVYSWWSGHIWFMFCSFNDCLGSGRKLRNSKGVQPRSGIGENEEKHYHYEFLLQLVHEFSCKCQPWRRAIRTANKHFSKSIKITYRYTS